MFSLNPNEEASEKVTPPILMFRGENDVSTISLSPLSFGYPHESPEPPECRTVTKPKTIHDRREKVIESVGRRNEHVKAQEAV